MHGYRNNCRQNKLLRESGNIFLQSLFTLDVDVAQLATEL